MGFRLLIRIRNKRGECLLDRATEEKLQRGKTCGRERRRSLQRLQRPGRHVRNRAGPVGGRQIRQGAQGA